MRKRLLLATVLPVAGFLIWLLWTAVVSYLWAPRLVEDLDRAGALPCLPSVLTKNRLCALLAVQDPTFYTHHGIGFADGPPGHTTITQAIGKGLFFDGFSPGLLRHRKIRLMVAALALDLRVSKETQLRVYLNRTYFGEIGGRSVVGFPAAASTFYRKTVGQLSGTEYLGLLAMLEAPNRHHVLLQPEANAGRVGRIREQVLSECGEQ